PSPIASRALWARLGGLDPRYPVSFLITLILVLGEARYGILGGYDRLVTALGVCTATELVLSRTVRGRFAGVQSAYITGISLALLIKPRAGLLWPFALGGFVAIASKYVLQYRGRPAARRHRAAHRPDVPAVHLLHGHRPQDDREHPPRTDDRRGRRRPGRGGHPDGGGLPRGGARPAVPGSADCRVGDSRAARQGDGPAQRTCERHFVRSYD